MLRQLSIVAVVGVGSAGTLVLAGCASDRGADAAPYSLAGESAEAQQRREKRIAYTDEKGHYRPDWEVAKRPRPGYNKPAP